MAIFSLHHSSIGRSTHPLVAAGRYITRNEAYAVILAERMTEGRTPWMAAIHDGPGDADSPRAHIILRDRDVEAAGR